MRLSVNDIVKLRKMYKSGKYSLKEMAETLNISVDKVRSVIKNEM